MPAFSADLGFAFEVKDIHIGVVGGGIRSLIGHVGQVNPEAIGVADNGPDSKGHRTWRFISGTDLNELADDHRVLLFDHLLANEPEFKVTTEFSTKF